jgi:hypothetical protein
MLTCASGTCRVPNLSRIAQGDALIRETDATIPLVALPDENAQRSLVALTARAVRISSPSGRPSRGS